MKTEHQTLKYYEKILFPTLLHWDVKFTNQSQVK